MTIHELLSRVELAPEPVLLKSRMHCHAKNVSSVVVSELPNGSLMRAFLAWPGHRLYANSLESDLEVGIHDHKYELSLELVAGNVKNVTYGRRINGRRLNEWRFRSGVETGIPTATLVGTANIAETSRVSLSREFLVTLYADTLHNIECAGAAAWLVIEGTSHRETTTLLTAKGKVETGGLYEKFETRDDVIQHVLDWSRLF